VNPHTKLVVGLGYNGFPRGVNDSEERLNTRELKYKYVVHAEVNAILMAKEKAVGASLYVWPSFAIPCICHDCIKVAIQAGVREVVGLKPLGDDRASRWQESIDIARSMCDEAKVTYRSVE
jgi:dCMP deaminase